MNSAVVKDNEDPGKRTDNKCGARLKAKDEYQEWLEKQEDLKRNPEKEGSNIFTYRNRKSNNN